MLAAKFASLPAHTRSQLKHELRWMIDHIRHQRRVRFSPLISSRQRLLKMIEQRVDKHKPIQYILQSQPFNSINVITRPPVLIPRPETEEWSATLSDLLIQNHTQPPQQPSQNHNQQETHNQHTSHDNDQHQKPLRILDICSGSGCIGLSIAHRLSLTASPIPCHLTALDSNIHAIRLSAFTARSHNLLHASSFHHVDVLTDECWRVLDTRGPFDVIVANPPYVRPEEYRLLEKDVTDWEDPRALCGSSGDVMEYYERIVRISERYLSSRVFEIGRVWMEVGGLEQAENVISYVRRIGKRLCNGEVRKDVFGCDRVVVFRTK